MHVFMQVEPRPLPATHLSAALCSSAAAPATSGQAMEVPSIGPYLHRAVQHSTAQYSRVRHACTGTSMVACRHRGHRGHRSAEHCSCLLLTSCCKWC